MSTPAPWFQHTLATGLQRLAAVALPAAPQGEALGLACAVWIDVLWQRRTWYEDTDPARLAEAFADLAASARRWPAPVELLDHLPARPQPRALPAPTRHRTGRHHLMAMRDLIRAAERRFTPTQPEECQP